MLYVPVEGHLKFRIQSQHSDLAQFNGVGMDLNPQIHVLEAFKHSDVVVGTMFPFHNHLQHGKHRTN